MGRVAADGMQRCVRWRNNHEHVLMACLPQGVYMLAQTCWQRNEAQSLPEAELKWDKSPWMSAWQQCGGQST